MSLFKEKNRTKPDNYDKRLTIDAKHKKKIQTFDNEIKKINNLKKIYENKKSQYDLLLQKKKKDMSDTDIDKFFELKEYLDLNKEKISRMEDNTDKKKYLLETSHLLFQYYDKINNKNTEYNKPQFKSNKKCVLDFFKKGDESNKKDTNNENSSERLTVNDKNNESKKISKSEIINNYLLKIEDNFIYPFNEDNDITFCKECNKEKTIVNTEGIIVCTNCGNMDHIIIESEKPSYKDPPREISYFAYKRINHFNEWLAQFQAKESTEIPKEVFDKILLEIKKERIENMALLSPSKLREILKKLKLNKYYEHVPHIINRLNGLPAPVMTRETEEKLRMMFKEIQTPFLKYCPKDRKNFLSYSYVLHKFVQLLELDEFLSCFPLLKSREKLHQQDIIWKKICKDLHWEYIKSL